MTLTDLARRVRHNRLLAGQDWLWAALARPYDLALRLRGRTTGIPRTVNGRRLRLRYPYGKLVAGDYEATCLAAVREVVGPGMVALDIGASFGVYTLSMANMVAPGGRVYAFEPMHRTAVALKDHVRLNGIDDRVTVVETVVSDVSGTVNFYEPSGNSSATTNMMASMAPEWVGARNKSAAETEVNVERASTTVDDFCAEHDIAPDFVKVDVEGAEAFVLRGARQFLERRKGHLLLEVHPHGLELLGESAQAVLKQLSDAGWSYREVEQKTARDGGVSTVTFLCAAADPAG